MTPFLKSITATNFRSIKALGDGAAWMPRLSFSSTAKTERARRRLLSAIELGLTAQVCRRWRDSIARLSSASRP